MLRYEDPNHDTLTVPVGELAKYFMVSEAAVMKYAREGGMPKGSIKGRYPLRDCVKWMVERLKMSKGDESRDIIEERRKLIVSQRVGQELENSKTRSELLDAELVGSAVQHMGALIATQLDGLAPRVVPQLMQIRDPVAISRVLTDECRSIRRAASGAIASFADSLVAVEDSRPAAEKRRGRVGRREPDTTAGLA